MPTKSLLFFILLLISCKQPDANNSDRFVGRIDFKVKTDDTAEFKNGYIPWVELENPDHDLKRLIDKDQLVIDHTRVILVIDYPLTKECRFVLNSKTGFTRELLIKVISDTYHKIYREEEATATVKTVPMDKRPIRNRNETNGKYGVMLHDLADLALDDIEIYQSSNGDIVLNLDIDS